MSSPPPPQSPPNTSTFLKATLDTPTDLRAHYRLQNSLSAGSCSDLGNPRIHATPPSRAAAAPPPHASAWTTACFHFRFLHCCAPGDSSGLSNLTALPLLFSWWLCRVVSCVSWFIVRYCQLWNCCRLFVFILILGGRRYTCTLRVPIPSEPRFPPSPPPRISASRTRRLRFSATDWCQ